MGKENLKFRPDGTFTIVQFTDLHWKNGEEEDQRSYDLMKNILQKENPDLVVFTGDVIHSEECVNPCDSFRNAIKAVDEFQISWAVVFGNHDAEKVVTKEELIRISNESMTCLSESGPSEINGVGNYVIQIKSSKRNKAAAALYFLDSGSYSRFQKEGYDWIHHSQIDWYREQSKRLKQLNNGEPLPSLAFFHIPLPEYKEVWDYHICYGDNYEGIGCPDINSGMVASILEMGDIHGVFVGHDHINDFEGEFKGIRLCYGRATGYNTYGKEGFAKGARLIQIKEDTHSFTTWISLDDGSIITNPKRHPPDFCDQ